MTGSDDAGTTIEFDAANGWVKAVIEGPLNIDITLSTFRRVREKAVECGTRKLLMDLRSIQPSAAFIDSYMFAKNFRERTGIDNNYRLAVLFNPAIYPKDRADTLQMVSRNWGNIAGKMFTDEEEALEFLRTG